MIDFEAEGLLDGLDGREREARMRLLEELAAEGVPLDELRRAVAEDRLALLPVERVLEGGGPRYTAAEVAERAGVEVGLLERQRRALGLSVPARDERVFNEQDVEAARRLRAFLEAGLPEDGVFEVTRVVGMGMAQIAAATRELIAEALLRPGDTERDVGRRYAEAARSLGPMIGPLLEHVFYLHQREQVRSEVVGAAEREAGSLPGSAEVGVCFADIVGFTRLGESLPPEELGAVTGRLSELAGEVAGPPVRLVKLIGDAAMLVSPETDPLLDAALALVEEAEAEREGFPLLRAGVAHGRALPRGGDWYGRPVNVASRITAIAYPGSVLCASEVREAAGDGYGWSSAGSRRLKGIRESIRLYRARRG
ncbi:MAG: adenylate cyclase regulatory domain-containing protein [Solirubrobacterales bacterium]